jgi:hypothetical protein
MGGISKPITYPMKPYIAALLFNRNYDLIVIPNEYSLNSLLNPN